MEMKKWLMDNVSTHTPHAGRDGRVPDRNQGEKEFLLTRPMRDVTVGSSGSSSSVSVSTHTPHAGRDSDVLQVESYRDGFYSHAPCGT